MSQKKYCPTCGKPNEYINGIAPVLCAGCKTSFASAFEVEVTLPKIPKPVAKKTKQAKAKVVEEEEDEDFSDEDEEFTGEIVVPRKFEVEINIPKRLSIREIAEGKQVNGFNLGGLPPSSFD